MGKTCGKIDVSCLSFLGLSLTVSKIGISAQCSVLEVREIWNFPSQEE